MLPPPTSVSRRGSNHNLTSCLPPSFRQRRSWGRSSHQLRGVMSGVGSAPGLGCCTAVPSWHDSARIYIPHWVGAAAMAPVSPHRCCRGQPRAGHHPCLHPGRCWHSRAAREELQPGTTWRQPRHGAAAASRPRGAAGGVSPLGLGVREEMLVPGGQQALLSSKSSTCHGGTAKGPVGQRREAEQSGTSLVRQPKRSQNHRITIW